MIRSICYIFSLFVFQGCSLSFQPKSGEQVLWQHVAQEQESTLDSYDTSAQSPDRQKVVTWAKAQLGTPYRYGGMDESGFDCSGFVCYVYLNALNKKLPHNAKMLSEYVQIYDLDQLEEGDLVFFDTSGRGKINHVGIYLGNGKFIHASSGKVYSVTISDLTKGFYKRAFRWGGKIQRW